jgi:hypothetical protein
MEDQTPANESNDPGLNKIDLSQLQDFKFGTQWTEVKPVSPGRREPGERGPMRERRDDGPGRPGEPRRDRRSFRRPPPGVGGPGGYSGEAAGGTNIEPRRADERPRFQGSRSGPPPQAERQEGNPPFERGPYLSPYFNLTCYPEDAGFAALVKAVRASCRTFQLFEIAKAILEKNDRFVVVLTRRKPESPKPATSEMGRPRPVESAPAVAGDVPAGAPPKPETTEPPVPERHADSTKPGPLFVAMPDGLPFETEEAAIQHVMRNHLGTFYATQEVEIDPPKGNFPIINRCTITGELLGPPNYHLYQQLIQKHHATRLGRMPFDRFRERIESVRDPEVVNQWLDKMKKATRYTWIYGQKAAPDAPAVVGGSTPEQPTSSEEAAPASATAEPAASVEAPVPATTPVPVGPAFDSYDEARAYLLSNARDKVVRAFDTVRFHGRLIEKLPPGEIRRATEGHVERQRRFPLDTANALRGRLRREGFTIFKKGSRGVSYVCAVKRRFRVPGQVFSDSITALIDFIEKRPLIHRKDLTKDYLGIDVAAAVAAASLPEGTPPSQAPFAALPAADAERLRRMNNDLRWLVIEGYVTEFSDGKLFAPPPVAPHVQKKADEHGEEHDLEDFPEAPAAPVEPAPSPVDTAPATETPQSAAEAAPPAPVSSVEAAPEVASELAPAPAAVEPAPSTVADSIPAPAVEGPAPVETPAPIEPSPAEKTIASPPAQ